LLQGREQVAVLVCADKSPVLVAELGQDLKGAVPLYRRIPKLKHFPIVNQKEFTIINVGKLSDFA
jgi:hypothetical protein